MPDTRKHRGPHPTDGELFAPPAHPVLLECVEHLAWLLSRGYAPASALKLVGDRFGLTRRQRLAVMRSTCSDGSLADRRTKELPPAAIAGLPLLIDGFNLLTTIEAALAGGVLLRGRDGALRDMASMHGSYRKVAETRPALIAIGQTLASLSPGACRWLFDRPVSNSGRLVTLIGEIAQEHDWPWQAELEMNPDPVLAASHEPIVSADAIVLDGCRQWFNAASEVVAAHVPRATIVDLRLPADRK